MVAVVRECQRTSPGAGYWTEAFTDQPQVLDSHVDCRILSRYREAGFGIPFPQTVVHKVGPGLGGP